MDRADALTLSSKEHHCLLMGSYSAQDGGSIYITKQTEYLFGDFTLYNLSKTKGYLGVISNLYLGRVWTKIRRLGLLLRINVWIEKLLAQNLAREFIRTYNLKNLYSIGCVSEDPLSFLVASNIKKYRPDIKIHFSMLDLPWSYSSTPKYSKMLKDKIIDRFVLAVDSADFCTPKMKEIFVKRGFLGMSLVTYSGIYIALQSKNRSIKLPNNVNTESLNIVLAGATRAAKEIHSFCDGLSLLNYNKSKQITIHLLGPYDFSHNNVEYLGFKSHGELEKLLQNYSLGLVAMSFADSDGDLVATSFPSKVWLYLVNGIVPIIYAPRNSGVAELVKKFKLGVVISDKEEIGRIFTGSDLAVIYQECMVNFSLYETSLLESFASYRKQLKLKPRGII